MIEEILAFYKARLDEDEAAAKNRTCVNCGRPLAPVRNALGITGYTHHGEWQGQRCQGRLTGAEPVQNPARVLREVAAERRIIERYEENPTEPWPLFPLLLRVEIYDFHPDYDEVWRP